MTNIMDTARYLELFIDHDESEHVGLNKHQCRDAYLLNGKSGASAMDALRVYVPLKFWFNRNPGLALPLIALQYHEVKVKLTTRGMLGLVNSTTQLAGTAAAPNVGLWVDYIYLDTDKEEDLLNNHTNILLNNYKENRSQSTYQKLNFNHPVKELVWVVQDDTVLSENSTFNATDVNVYNASS